MNTYNNNNTIGGNPYGSDNPYGTAAAAAPNQGYGNNYAGAGASTGVGAGGDDVGFYNDINDVNVSLDNYNVLIDRIQTTQRRILSEVDEEQEFLLRKDVDNLTSQAFAQQGELKTKIKYINSQIGADGAKKEQADTVKEHFLQLIQKYRSVEDEYKTRTKDQAIRQYKIVQPEASNAEAAAAIEDVGGQQIFSQALLNSNRRGEARTALSEVQARHREIQKIEQSMRELNQLFQDVEALVAEQDTAVQHVNERVTDARHDIESGVKEEEVAIEKAKKSRRKKCWCIWISIIIIIIIIAAIVGGIAGKFANKK